MVRDEERTGTVIDGKWRIDALLGRGGMCAVYGATHRNGRRVAIKLLHRELTAVPEVRERFRREGYVANRIDHPGVVAVLDDGETAEGEPFLVMERLDGCSLDRWVDIRAPLDGPTVVHVLARLLDVLAAAHDAGVVHRDLKPENVFVTADGALKLLDFGIARAHERSGTQTGMVMGTPAYMAPEQALGLWDQVDARSDVFAAGAIGWALLAGRRPRAGATENIVLLGAMTEPVEPIASERPDTPPSLAAVITQALAQDARDRFADARAMLGAIDVVAAELGDRDARSRPLALPPPRALEAAAEVETTVAEGSAWGDGAAASPRRAITEAVLPPVARYAPARTPPEPRALGSGGFVPARGVAVDARALRRVAPAAALVVVAVVAAGATLGLLSRPTAPTSAEPRAEDDTIAAPRAPALPSSVAPSPPSRAPDAAEQPPPAIAAPARPASRAPTTSASAKSHGARHAPLPPPGTSAPARPTRPVDPLDQR